MGTEDANNLRRYLENTKLDLNIVRMEIIKKQIKILFKIQNKASKYSHNVIRQFINYR